MAGVALLTLLAAVPARADLKFAYVDIQRALNECEAGKAAKADFRNRVELIEGKLQKEQQDVQVLKDELEKKGMLMRPDQRQNLQDDYANKLKNFERDYKDSKDDLEQKDNEVTGKIVHDLAAVIHDLGEKSGYTMVFEKGSILWGSPGIDITDQVIRAYNGMHVKLGSLGIRATGDDEGAGGAEPSDFGSDAAKRSTISK